MDSHSFKTTKTQRTQRKDKIFVSFVSLWLFFLAGFALSPYVVGLAAVGAGLEVARWVYAHDDAKTVETSPLSERKHHSFLREGEITLIHLVSPFYRGTENTPDVLYSGAALAVAIPAQIVPLVQSHPA